MGRTAPRGKLALAALTSACLAIATGVHAQDAGLDGGVPSLDGGAPSDAGAPSDRGPEHHDDAPAPLVPPRLERSTQPRYPEARLAEALHPTVVLLVTLDERGMVVDARVEHSADPDFDAAAIEAVRTWAFAPARRGEVPIASRVRVAVHFELPSFDVATAEPIDADVHESHPEMELDPHEHVEAQEADAEPQPETDPEPNEPELGVTAEVEHALHSGDRGASSYEVGRDLIEAAPRREGADLLLSVPGVFAARAEGLAVGQHINLRGFDAEHGQDIELRVGGLPVNLPSHIHGQGYADLGFLIPEVVRRVRAIEGVADPTQGDFAVAGTISFDLGVEPDRRGWRISSGYGLYDTFRQLAMWAPEGERTETFGAVAYQHTDGYGQNRAGDSVSAIAQVAMDDGRWRWRGLGIFYGARAQLAGVLRVDDVDAGTVGYYDAYPAETAQNMNAFSARFLLGFSGEMRGDNGEDGGFGVWVGGDTFRLQENFTGFVQRSRTLPNVFGRGDLIEQRNETLSAGLNARYHTPAWEPFEWARARIEMGLDGRIDGIGQAQNLLGAPRNQTWDQRVDASVVGANLALYGDAQISLWDRVTIHAGLRAAMLLYEIDDRLGNFVPLVRPRDEFIMGFRRSAGGATVGPRLSAEVKPVDWLSLRASYGHGYRSPQARTLDDGESAPFTEVRAADLGALATFDRIVRVGVTGYWTELSDDVAFDPREGRLERIGASRRLGVVAHVETRPLEWLVGQASVTYVDAELLEPPPPSAEDPNPPFVAGQNLPYVPPVVIRVDVGAHGTLLPDVLGEELRGRIGVGYSFLSPRPLPFGGLADPVNLFDASASLGWGAFTLGASFFNVFDTRYAASEFVFTSNWDPDAIPTRLPARHRSAGAPFTFMVTLEVAP